MNARSLPGLDPRVTRFHLVLHGTVVAVGLALALAGCSKGGGGGKGGGPGVQADLLVTVGANNPGSTQAAPMAADVAVLQLALEVFNKDVLIDGIQFHASGSGNDTTGIAQARLFRDLNDDGSLDPGDPILGTPATIATDDGIAMFSSLGVTIPSATKVNWLVVYDLAPGPAAGHVFCASVIDETDIAATADGNPALVAVTGAIQGCLDVLGGSLSLSLGSATPPAGNVSLCATAEPVLQLQLDAGPVEDISVDAIIFSASGTGDDVADLALVWLYVDANANGLLDFSDVLLGAPGSYSSDNGSRLISGLGRTISASTSEAWLLVYDFSGTGTSGGTFEAAVAADIDVIATGTQTGSSATVSGAPVVSSSITAVDSLLESAVYQDVNDNGVVDPGDTLTIRFLYDISLGFMPEADATFELDPPDSFGPFVVVDPGSAPNEVEIVLDFPMSFQPNGVYLTDPGSTGINLRAAQFSIRGCTGAPVPALATPIDLGGVLPPKISYLTLRDLNLNCGIDSGDEIEVTFSTNVTFSTSDPRQAFVLPVMNDDLGAGATFAGGGTPTNVSSVTIVPGAGVVLTLLGSFDAATTNPGSPSGLDVTSSPGVIVHAAYPSVGATPKAPPGVDVPDAVLWTSVGDDQDDAIFGASVSVAGDVNGDGYSDVIVGATTFDTPNFNAGKAYVYLGGASGLSTTPVWTSSGDNEDQGWFGTSVASAGDVDNDGYDDIIVGAIFDDGATQHSGKAYVYLGGPSGPATSPLWTSHGDDQSLDEYGASVASAGDVNNDGYDDIVVGATQRDLGPSTAYGKAFLYHGGPGGPSPAADWMTLGEDIRSHFGNSVASAGDVNNDGYSDVIVGSYSFSTVNVNAGKAYVYLGGVAGLSTTAVWSSSGDDQAMAQYGISVGSAGDVDGDGFDDVIVGAHRFDTVNADAGKAYLYLGGAGGPSATADWTSTGDDSMNVRFGGSVASAGDVNQDTYSDIVISAPGGANTWDPIGKVFVFLGGPGGLSLTPQWSSQGDEQVGALFGNSVSTAGDIIGDGTSEIIAGSSRFRTTRDRAGKAYVFCVP